MAQDCRMCICRTHKGDCTKDSYTDRKGNIYGMARCVIHDKKAKTCPYYWEGEDLREYYEKHPFDD